jgi:hypothetical protein
VIDAFPGVYGPQAFSRVLADTQALFTNLKGKDEAAKRNALLEYYSSRANKISLSWLADVTKIGGKRPEGISVQVNDKGEALSIMPLAVSKAVTELQHFVR